MKAELVAQPAQQHLEHDIVGTEGEVEGDTGAFVEGATTILAAKHGITQVHCAL